MQIAGIELRVIAFDGLREQYRRGVENTAANAADSDLLKHRATSEKLQILDSHRHRGQA